MKKYTLKDIKKLPYKKEFEELLNSYADCTRYSSTDKEYEDDKLPLKKWIVKYTKQTRKHAFQEVLELPLLDDDLPYSEELTRFVKNFRQQLLEEMEE